MAEPVKSEVTRTSSMPPTPAMSAPSASPPAANTNTVAPKRRLLTRARTFGGEKFIGRLLRTGAVLSGAMFVSSLALEVLEQRPEILVAEDLLRKTGLVVLVVTPIARLASGAALLALKGEWKYALYGAGVLALLALAVAGGFGA